MLKLSGVRQIELEQNGKYKIEKGRDNIKRDKEIYAARVIENYRDVILIEKIDSKSRTRECISKVDLYSNFIYAEKIN